MSETGRSADTLAIARSRKKTLATVAGSAAFVAVGVWMVIANETYLGIPTPAVGAVATAFFGVSLAFCVARLFDRRPGLTLSVAGFEDRSSGVAVGFVPWRDVRRIAVVSMMGTPYLAVFVDDAAAYASRGNMAQRAMRRANARICGTPITIVTNLLDVSFGELVRQFERAWSNASRGAPPSDNDGRPVTGSPR